MVKKITIGLGNVSTSSFTRVTLASLKRRSGLKLRDGTRVTHFLYGISIHKHALHVQGGIHESQEKSAIAYFAKAGFAIFPFHVAIEGHNVWADFAATRGRRVILVECVTDWREPAEMIQHKMRLAPICELWFVVQEYGKIYLKSLGYKVARLASSDLPFWICWPPTKKRPNLALQ